jgi:hypothetical protein
VLCRGRGFLHLSSLFSLNAADLSGVAQDTRLGHDMSGMQNTRLGHFAWTRHVCPSRSQLCVHSAWTILCTRLGHDMSGMQKLSGTAPAVNSHKSRDEAPVEILKISAQGKRRACTWFHPTRRVARPGVDGDFPNEGTSLFSCRESTFMMSCWRCALF